MDSSANKPQLGSTCVRDIFLEALDCAGAERARFLDVACAGDPSLRAKIDELLAEHETVGDFIESPAARPTTPAQSEGPGDFIGRYKLLEKIGEGGAGVVYMAEQTSPIRRRVALKVIKLGMDTRSIVARFEAERQALAMMDHPNIAKVFDGGATEAGRPYFVMELVRGVRITDYCNENQLTPTERLRLFVQVCQAIQHAHQKGIIHRDIKPSNILVTMGDLGPTPKVIDFGIAKATEQPLTEKTLFTEFRSFIGTPAYMSPEQIEMSGGDVDTRSDIYSLGVLLYELLTGATPFPASLIHAGVEQFRRTVLDKDPQLPSARITSLPAADLTTTAQQRHVDSRTFVRVLRGDLDWIVMRCLEKDRARRYATANDLATDVGRFLSGEPILARPPSATYRVQKFLRRHQLPVAAAIVVTLSLITASLVSIRQAARSQSAEKSATSERIKAEAESKRAQRNEARALLNEYVADITLAHEALNAGNFGRATFLLDKHAPQSGRADLRGFEWGYLAREALGSPHRILIKDGESVRSIAFSADGNFVAIGAREKTTVLNTVDFSVRGSIAGGNNTVAFAKDNSRLFIGDNGSIRAIDLKDFSESTLTKEAGGPFALSPDGKFLAASAQRDNVRVFQISPWDGKRTFFRSSAPFAFSPDSSHLVTATRRGYLDWEVAGDKNEPRELNGPGFFGFFFRTANMLIFSRDGSQFFAPNDRLLLGIDYKTGNEVGTIPKDGKALHTSSITCVALSPDGKTIATGSWDHSIQLWNAQTYEHVSALKGHLNEVWSLAFAPDGKTLISGAKDGGVFLWPLARTEESDTIAGEWQPIRFAADDRSFAAVNRRGTIAVIHLSEGRVEELWNENEQRRPGPGPGPQHAMSDDLQTFARILPDRDIELLDRKTGHTSRLRLGEDPVATLTLSHSGASLVASTWNRSLIYRDLRATNSIALPTGFDRALYMPDDRRLVLLGRSGGAVWNCQTHAIERNLQFENPPGFDASISPNGRILAAAAVLDRSNTIELMDLETGRSIGTLSGHKQGVTSVAFSADGKTLASSSIDGLILWNVATLQEILSLPIEGARGPVFSNTGTMLAFTVRDSSGERLRLLRAIDSPARIARHE